MTTPHVALVCSANMCRSPMAEAVFRANIDRARFSSCGVRPWNVGAGADPDAEATLRLAGYTAAGHRVRGPSLNTLRADLILLADPQHRHVLLRLGVPRDRMRALTWLDPLSADGETVFNPYRCGRDAFVSVLGLIERAVQPLREWVESR